MLRCYTFKDVIIKGKLVCGISFKEAKPRGLNKESSLRREAEEMDLPDCKEQSSRH